MATNSSIPFKGTNTTINMPDTWTNIMELSQGRSFCGVCTVQIQNTHASQAFSGLQICLKSHKDGEWFTILQDTDFTNTTLGNQLGSYPSGSNASHQLAAGEYTNVQFRLEASAGMKIQVKAAGACSAQAMGTYIPL